MRNLIRLAAVLLSFGLASPAWSADDQVVCKDGTTSKGGRGACRGHGGVDKKATKAAAGGAAAGQAADKAAAPEKKSRKAKKEKAAAEAANPAAEPAAMVVCKDGTTSKGGRGACRGHGGVDKKAGAGKAAAPAAAAPATPAAPAAPAAAPAQPAAPAAPAAAPRAPAAPHQGGATPANTDPTGATARCKDGTYSHAQHHTGACSNHGGVAEWLDKKP